MIDIILTVNKEKVYEEVAKTTSYTGAKMDDELAYDRIFTTDEDKCILERFWCESRNTICNSLKKVLLDETEDSSEYRLSLGLSNSFKKVLKESMQRSLFSFFVMNITAKWYTFTNKEEAAGYATEAATYMEDIMRKAFFKIKPIRPTYEQSLIQNVITENKNTLTVIQQVKELVYDIQNKTYLTGQAREATGKSYQVASNMQADDDSENSYQIRRSLANAFSSLKSLLGEYLNEDNTTRDNLMNEEIDNNGKLSLEFLLPSNYDNASADALGNGIHSYLVDMALGEWFAINSPEDADVYIQHSEVSLENVKHALYKRSRPERPTHD